MQLSRACRGVGFRTPAEASHAQQSGKETLDLHAQVRSFEYTLYSSSFTGVLSCVTLLREGYTEPFLSSVRTVFEPSK